MRRHGVHTHSRNEGEGADKGIPKKAGIPFFAVIVYEVGAGNSGFLGVERLRCPN